MEASRMDLDIDSTLRLVGSDRTAAAGSETEDEDVIVAGKYGFDRAAGREILLALPVTAVTLGAKSRRNKGTRK